MSVSIASTKPTRRWLSATPLLLSALLLVGAGFWLWQQWPQLLLQSVLWQKALHQQMTALLQQVELNPHQAGLTLLGFSVIYGILHAAGPGHGKVVIATFLATHPTKVKTSLQLTLAAAVVQGLMAIVLVTVLLVVLKLSSRQLHLSSYWLEKGSYLVVMALGAWLCLRALRQLWRLLRPVTLTTITAIRAADHLHHSHCGCGHQHVPDNARLAQVVGWKTKMVVVLSMGLRPCSGALMMLLFAKVIGVYFWGVLSAIAMALGTALTVSAMALLVQTSRALASRLSRTTTPSGWQKVAVQSIGLLGGVLLIIAGVMLWQSAQPAISGGIRRIL
ncbi:nickel/cobalt transporter [Erwiniaceae bacterium BAC15a-03b]|uniref:Nickel/cobalt efflux system n=1 Tax=Winslowiella arboricola TaxID=2978220 RepID=A0A9J6PIY3_9GAMM|nr:nickel/cobalt transporter [Winslowiella arboricola]MCU5773951.1 nickel/cobalt transporter [Winslowiella arboricola]MCU5777322.1 nickel/cobalt transporter [Winslowiella arboricola]